MQLLNHSTRSMTNLSWLITLITLTNTNELVPSDSHSSTESVQVFIGLRNAHSSQIQLAKYMLYVSHMHLSKSIRLYLQLFSITA